MAVVAVPRDSSRVVLELADGLIEDRRAAPPLLPDGEYLARYVNHLAVKMREFGNAPKVFVNFRLHEPGPHYGTVLFRAYRALAVVDEQHFRLARRSDLLREYCRLMDEPDHRPRRDRISLRSLKSMMVRVRTRTVSRYMREGEWRDLAPELRYSVVAEVLRREA